LSRLNRLVSLLRKRHLAYGAYGLTHRVYSKLAGRILDVEILHHFDLPLTTNPSCDPATCVVVPPHKRDEYEKSLRGVGAWERFSEYPPETIAVMAIDSDGTACGRILAHPSPGDGDEPDGMTWWIMAVHVDEAYRGRGFYDAMLHKTAHYVRQTKGDKPDYVSRPTAITAQAFAC
jgi:hypothetical protein